MDSSRKRRRLLALLPAASDAIRREADSLSYSAFNGCDWRDAELIGRIYFDHDGEARPSNLVGLAYTTGTGVTGSLRRLEEAGLVERKRIESDRRALLVTLTELGRRKVEAAIPRFDELAEATFGNLSEDELDLVYDFATDQLNR